MKDTSFEQARCLTILRGVLAESSGKEDDLWNRVFIVRGSAGKSALRVEAKDLVGSDGEIREHLQSRVKEQASLIAGINLAGMANTVVREKSSVVAPLRGKIALVTGAAGAIGAGICRGLLKLGCRVAAADVAKDRLDSLSKEMDAGDRFLGVIMDVTDKESVAKGFQSAVLEWGGVDIVIPNAGIAMVSPLVDMDLEAFRRIERVNVDGTLLTLAEAGRVLGRQGTGGDIVLVSTKNVFAPGAQFGAYSATKAASHQLARIASLELASLDIRVNMVAPDAVFSDGERKSGLWAEVGPSRMKARGLDEKGLEEYYRSRNLLKRRVTAEHVANAVAFFVTRQTPTTGATIPVDGGLPDATPR